MFDPVTIAVSAVSVVSIATSVYNGISSLFKKGSEDMDKKKAEEIAKQAKQHFLNLIDTIKYKIDECCELSCRIYWTSFYASLVLIILLLLEIYVVAYDWRGRVKGPKHPVPKTQQTIIMMKPTVERIKPNRERSRSKKTNTSRK